jgi:hypothetical protein
MVFKCLNTAGGCHGFGLGLACGLVLASAGFMLRGLSDADAMSAEFAAPGAASAPGTWHHPTASGDLARAVQVSAALLSGDAGLIPVGPRIPATDDVQAALARAEEHRRKREFSDACAIYASIAARGGMTADAWADYADAQATLGGRLSGAPSRSIEAALVLDPGHPKALWLRASLAHEEHRYAEALESWRRLLAVVPPGSNDARIVEANIAEALRLAAG